MTEGADSDAGQNYVGTTQWGTSTQWSRYSTIRSGTNRNI